MQTFILLAIAVSVLLGITLFCVDFYRNRNHAVDPSTLHGLSVLDTPIVTPLDVVSMTEVEATLEGIGNWAEAAGSAIEGVISHH